MMFGTDPVAIDRLLLDVIDDKRKAEHATSVWDRSMAHVKSGRDYDDNPSINRFIREPGHIEYASKLGLGVYDIGKIQVQEDRALMLAFLLAALLPALYWDQGPPTANAVKQAGVERLYVPAGSGGGVEERWALTRRHSTRRSS